MDYPQISVIILIFEECGLMIEQVCPNDADAKANSEWFIKLLLTAC